MIPARQHLQRLTLSRPAHPVHQPVFGGDPAGPPAGQVALERFGFTGAAKRIALTFGDQGVEPFQHFGVFALPREIIAPRVGAESDDQG